MNKKPKRDLALKPRKQGTIPAEKLLALLMQEVDGEVAYEKFNEMIGDMIEEDTDERHPKKSRD